MADRYRATGFGRAGLLLGSLLLSLVLGEALLRWRFPETAFMPGPQIRAVQDQLVLHPRYGYLWRPGVGFDEDVRLSWKDQVVERLSTDRFGFRNHPDAIARLEAGDPVDLVGLGDSFMEGGAYRFQALFGAWGLRYYNLAMHRHCPPQYNRILEDHAIGLRPRFIVYGIYENDFLETLDFDDWVASGLDWFAFHSGFWAGPPKPASLAERVVQARLPGFHGLYRQLTFDARKRAFRDARARELPGNVARHVLEAQTLARAAGIRLIVMLIPSKATAFGRVTPEARLYDRMLPRLRASGATLLDLRETFAASGRRPRDLYYRVDPHWNAEGMAVAARAIHAIVAGSDAAARSRSKRVLLVQRR